MRVFVLLVLLFLVVNGGFAQETDSSGPASLRVIKHSWSKERIGWANDPFSVPNERYNEMRERVRNERRPRSALEEKAVRSGKEDPDPAKPPRYIFNYSITVSNTAARTIREIDLDYVFTDASTGEELGRREFTIIEKVGAGKTKKLVVRASLPPTNMVSIYSLGTNEREGLAEDVVVLRILYDDGTVWTAH